MSNYFTVVCEAQRRWLPSLYDNRHLDEARQHAEGDVLGQNGGPDRFRRVDLDWFVICLSRIQLRIQLFKRESKNKAIYLSLSK